MPNVYSPLCGGLCVEKASRSPSKSCAGRWDLARTGEREAVFHLEFRQDLRHWTTTDRKVALRIFELIEAVLRDPFTGIGKPEPLKYVLAGCWSRRVTQEHRLVYRVNEGRIDFLQARYHY
jgi:toxin YoeB